jgi:hypothetical protein
VTGAISKYPLVWPDGLPRSDRPQSSQFKTGLSQALKNVQESLRLFGTDTGKPVADIILSSNVGGLDPGQPEDPGVAAWFMWEGQQRCVAVDRYKKVEENLQAIHHVLEARRTEMRHGGLHIVRQTFKGFTSLPAPPGKKGWRQVLNFPPNSPVTPTGIDERYRELAKRLHPDTSDGDHGKMSELNAARAEAKMAIA